MSQSGPAEPAVVAKVLENLKEMSEECEMSQSTYIESIELYKRIEFLTRHVCSLCLGPALTASNLLVPNTQAPVQFPMSNKFSVKQTALLQKQIF